MVFERYTKRTDGMVFLTDAIDGKYEVYALVDVLLERLAEYEDAGLTPEGVKDLQSRAKAAELSVGASLHHVVDLVQAERSGRLLILPCRVGATVYVLQDDEVFEATVWNIESYRNVRGDPVVLFVCGPAGTFCLEDWGKTVFADERQALHALAVQVRNRGEALIPLVNAQAFTDFINKQIVKEE